jgi:hypothetical protein
LGFHVPIKTSDPWPLRTRTFSDRTSTFFSSMIDPKGEGEGRGREGVGAAAGGAETGPGVEDTTGMASTGGAAAVDEDDDTACCEKGVVVVGGGGGAVTSIDARGACAAG